MWALTNCHFACFHVAQEASPSLETLLLMLKPSIPWHPKFNLPPPPSPPNQKKTHKNKAATRTMSESGGAFDEKPKR